MPTKGTIQQAQTSMTAAQNAPTTKDFINNMLKSGQIAKALPSVMTAERFTRITLSTLSSNQKLQSCTPQSFLAAMMTAAQLGLEPNTPLGQAYLIPYGNQCQFQLGYKGLIDLAYRSGEMLSVQAHTVYSGDKFEFSFGLEPALKHVPAKSNRGEPEYFYAVYRTKDGGFGFEVASLDDMRKHAQKYSKSYGNGPWQSNFEEMAKKTVLKRALKYAPLKTEFAKGVASDETVKTEIVENMTDVNPVYIEEETDSNVVLEMAHGDG